MCEGGSGPHYPESRVRVTSFDPERAPRKAFAALARLEDRICAEREEQTVLDAGRVTPGAIRQELIQLRHVAQTEFWSAEIGRRLVGTARLVVRHGEDNPHAAFFRVDVSPRQRRRQVGSRLLARVAATAEREGRSLLIGAAGAQFPAAEAFLKSIGARRALVLEYWELEIGTVDAELLRSWQESGRAAAYELGTWQDRYPLDVLPELARVKQAMNLAPREGLRLQDHEWTPGALQQAEDYFGASGLSRLTLYARAGDGRIAGYTEVVWNGGGMAQQGDTVVLPEHQRRGLARRLKAAMLDHLRASQPEIDRVRTSVARTNEGIRRINQALGFAQCGEWALWQAETAAVRARLQSRGICAEEP